MLDDECIDTATAGIVNRATWDCNQVFAAALTDTGQHAILSLKSLMWAKTSYFDLSNVCMRKYLSEAQVANC